MFGRLLSVLFGRSRSDHSSFKKAISIDVSSPEFYDLYPSKDQWRTAIGSTGAIKPDALEWVVNVVDQATRGGSAYRSVLENVTRAGEQVSPERLKSLGFNPRRKLGEGFLSSLAHDRASEAIDTLQNAIHVTRSNQLKVHDLSRKRDAGITHVVFRSVRDERNTQLENELEGKRMTIDEAVHLVETHGPEIRRSCFRGEVHY